jgi:hypothetical protein
MTNRNIDLGISKGSSIMQTKSIGIVLVLAIAAALATGGGGCSSLPRVERVQTNLIDKSIFEGDWWYTRTVIQLDDDAAYAIGAAGTGSPWAGAMSNYDITAQSGVIGRIRWVIDEQFLYAYRATEVIPGSNADIDSPSFRGSPLAVYRITNHVDVRQEYNPGTGEPTNVISENMDRRWYDRQFLRVDWSQNLVSFGQFGDSLEIDELFGTFRREPAPLGIVDQGNSSGGELHGSVDLPAEWAPQFVRVAEDEAYRFRSEWPVEQQDTVHYMSFVTQELWSPIQCFGTACQTTLAITTREAFLRIPPNHEYAVETLANSEYDRFGIIRTEQRTYLRGGLDRSELGEHCTSDDECTTGACDAARQICVGGLTDELGETDFLTYYRLRHNFYSDSLTDIECQADWQCSGRFDDTGTCSDGSSCAVGLDTCGDGNICRTDDGTPGSICDQHAHLCTIPIPDRPVREVAYYLSPGYPTYLTRSAFEVVSMWNEAFMRGNRAVHDAEPPSGPPVACQSDDPTNYCYCNPDHSFMSGEVDPDSFTCVYRVDWFATRQEQLDAGVTDPYNCWVEIPDDIADPTSFGDYTREVWSQTRFTSDPAAPSECMLVLRVNSCDVDPEAPCEQLGDIRYNMFNYVSAASTGFCGVMQPMQDPTNGEAIVSPINMGGQCLDNFGVQPLVYWPILRGDEPTDDLVSGDEVRRYFEALGNVRDPVGIAPGAEPGFDVVDSSRPSLPSDLHAFFRDQIEEHLPEVRSLHGAEGRAQLLGDRMGRVELTPEGRQFERRWAAASSSEGFPAPTQVEQMAATALDAGIGVLPQHMDLDDEATMDRISAFRPEFLDGAYADVRREQDLMTRGSCMMMERPALVFASQYGEYWARAFEESRFTREEARIRWQQAWHRAVMQHELGHGLGFEHNFAGSLDRDNYQSGYFGIVMRDETGPGGVGGPDGLPDLLLPRLIDFDDNRDGQITADEQTAWLAETQRVRHERNVRGAGNFTASSAMDYAGDLSDIYSIGPYDSAAVYFNYFNQIEAFENHCEDANGDGTLQAAECETPETDLPGTSADGLLRSDQFDRTLVPWYRGGDHCSTDAQCPFSTSGAGNGEAITQRCVTNPRYSTIPLPCGTAGSDADHCICSSFDSDFVDYVDGNAYRDRREGQVLSPVQYLFCSNPRLNDISWCSTFDAGESFQEVIANYRAEWESRYLTSYFRRFRRPFTTGSRAQRYIPDAAKIYQHFLFRLIYEPRFASDNGPLGLDDQYAASIDVMNWMAQLASMPDVGAYALDPTVGANGAYHHITEEYPLDGTIPAGADIVLEPGEGFYHWSQYQDGNLGFFRMERAGVFWDQLIALQALTIRDWGLSYTVDERYYINFYSFFPVEMTELFGGYILDDPEWYAPRIIPPATPGGDPQVQYVNWFRGTDLRGGGCRNPTTGVLGPCRPATQEAFPNPVIEDVSNDILRVYATVFALNQFPVFYDSSWERRLAIFALGSGDGFTIPDTQRDGSATCAYGPITTSPGHASGCTAVDADYITYTSDHLHSTYVAVKIRSRDTYNLEEEQLGFQFLYELSTTQDRVRVLDAREAAGTITAAERLELDRQRERLSSNESYLSTLIELQRIFGINSYL